MATTEDYTIIDRRTIASSGIGTSPQAIRAFEDLQQAAFMDNPAAATAAQTTANGAAAAAGTAQSTANSANTAAGVAQGRADDAYALALTKVTKDVGPTFTAPTGTVSRATFATYTAPTAAAAYDPIQMQALMDALQAVSQALAAVVTDLRANHALTP